MQFIQLCPVESTQKSKNLLFRKYIKLVYLSKIDSSERKFKLKQSVSFLNTVKKKKNRKKIGLSRKVYLPRGFGRCERQITAIVQQLMVLTQIIQEKRLRCIKVKAGEMKKNRITFFLFILFLFCCSLPVSLSLLVSVPL